MVLNTARVSGLWIAHNKRVLYFSETFLSTNVHNYLIVKSNERALRPLILKSRYLFFLIQVFLYIIFDELRKK